MTDTGTACIATRSASAAGGMRADERAAADYRRVRGAMVDAEREELLRLRDEGVISDAVVRRVQRDLDLEQLLLASDDPSQNEG